MPLTCTGRAFCSFQGLSNLIFDQWCGLTCLHSFLMPIALCQERYTSELRFRPEGSPEVGTEEWAVRSALSEKVTRVRIPYALKES